MGKKPKKQMREIDPPHIISHTQGAQERAQGKKCSITICVGRNGIAIKSLLKNWGSLGTHKGH